MASNLKRNTIELVKEVKEGEVITETYITPVFMDFSAVYIATDLMEDVAKNPGKKTERQIVSELADFVANVVYKGQFTKEELQNGLHAPNAVDTLYSQVLFIVRGEQSDETKKFLAKKR